MPNSQFSYQKQTHKEQYESGEPKTVLLPTKGNRIGVRRPGDCTLARKKLKKFYYSRKYYLWIIGLTGFEILLVLIRLILETESLRIPPGINQTMIFDAQLGLQCLSLCISVFFLIDVPLKMYAFGIRCWFKQLLLIIDGLVCAVFFSLSIYNIYRISKRTKLTDQSPNLIKLLEIVHIIDYPNTSSTFAIFSGIIVAYRLFYIKGYIKKLIAINLKNANKQINELRKIRDELQTNLKTLENNAQCAEHESMMGDNNPKHHSILRMPTKPIPPGSQLQSRSQSQFSPSVQ